VIAMLARALALGGWLLALLMVAGGGAAAWAGGVGATDLVWGWGLAEATIAVSFASVGALLAARRPANAVSWILLAMGLGPALGFFGGQAQADPGGIAFVELVAAVHRVVDPLALPALPLLALLLLLFPDGRLRSRRWSALAVIVAVAGAVQVAADAGMLPIILWDRMDLVLVPALVLAPASLVLRYRSAAFDQRQQLKLLTFALVAAVVVFLAGAVAGVAPVTNAVALPAIPAAIAVAVLRYRLYDIDRVISRTVSYAALTGVLAAVYAASVVAIGPLTAVRGSDSHLAVATATLIVAATFRPLRARVQAGVDRRFNRSRYDAHLAVSAFAVRMRGAVDLEGLRRELVEVVETTLQPSVVTVTLRGPGTPR
jgi:hypothetical protein